MRYHYHIRVCWGGLVGTLPPPLLLLSLSHKVLLRGGWLTLFPPFTCVIIITKGCVEGGLVGTPPSPYTMRYLHLIRYCWGGVGWHSSPPFTWVIIITKGYVEGGLVGTLPPTLSYALIATHHLFRHSYNNHPLTLATYTEALILSLSPKRGCSTRLNFFFRRLVCSPWKNTAVNNGSSTLWAFLWA